MLLNFKEIPQANKTNGLQDTFELFARDFLEGMGYNVLQSPHRGADFGKDLLVKEIRTGIGGLTHKKWLVSCKHYATSGKSVTQDDEPDILDRVNVHECDGFIGFYSTLPSSSLSNKLEKLKNKIETQIYDREKIEKRLLESIDGNKLSERYFPISYTNFKRENPSLPKLYSDQSSIHCDNCGKDLLNSKTPISGIFVELVDSDNLSHTKDVYFSCKGNCDSILRSKNQKKNLYDKGWDELNDLKIPQIFFQKINFIMNRMRDGQIYDKAAFKRFQYMFINCLPHISRELTQKEKQRVGKLVQIWDWL